MKYVRGGTLVGFIVGMVVGLGIALAVAVYVTKVPVPFMNKGQTRSAEQDAVESQKNQNWDPNALFYGKNPAPTVPQATVPSASAARANGVVDVKTGTSAQTNDTDAVKAKTDTKANSKADPEMSASADAKPSAKPSADPLGDLAKAKSGESIDGNAFTYWVQLGSFRSAEDAQSQRAKLSLSGIETKISEREVAGKQVFRVRVGPFEKKEDADSAKDSLDKAGLETALVRVQR